MNQPASSSSRVQDYLANLHHNHDRAAALEQSCVPSQSYFSPVSTGLETTHDCPRPAESPYSPVSSCTLSGGTLSSQTLSAQSTVMNDRPPIDREDLGPLNPLDRQYVPPSSGSASAFRNPSFENRLGNQDSSYTNTHANLCANFNHVFDLQVTSVNEDLGQAATLQRPPQRSYTLGRFNISNSFAPASRTQIMPQSIIREHQTWQVVDRTQQSQKGPVAVSLATPAVPVAIKARHDRNTHYTLTTRTDGSGFLIKVPMPPHQINLEEEELATPTESTTETEPLHQEAAENKENEETSSEFKQRLIYIIGQMMFVSGEQVEPSPETTWMIEEIVREQVVEMLKEATLLANRRGSKSISIVDLIFQIRHNPAKVSRLKTFLSWKDVRKNVKDSDDKAGGADADALDLEEGALPGANPAAPQKSSTTRKAKLLLPWEVQSFYNETVPEREDEEDEEEEEQNEATLARLASADERTKNMTREEYVYWSECRQASFTFRKGKRFREWAGFGTIIDSKPNDDVVDILGFLTFEIVQTITEEALKVKAAEDLANKKASGSRGDSENSKKRKREGCTLFEMVEEDKTPVEPKHVREAFRRLQIVPKKYTFMRQGYAGVRTPLRMI